MKSVEPVSYTHLDVYKRQPQKLVDYLVKNALRLSVKRLRIDLERQIRYRSLRLIVLYKIRWSKIRIDPRTMSLRSKTTKIGRLSC